jgi:hypothetical protein
MTKSTTARKVGFSILGGSAILAPVASQAAIDLTSAASGITTDLGAAQSLALPIFAIMFGIVLVLAFFKKATH